MAKRGVHSNLVENPKAPKQNQRAQVEALVKEKEVYVNLPHRISWSVVQQPKGGAKWVVLELGSHSLSNLVERWRGVPGHGNMVSTLKRSRDRGNFTGSACDQEDMDKLFEEGYSEGAEKARTLAESLEGHMKRENIMPANIRRVRKFGGQGDTLNEERLYEGRIDECWERRVRAGRALAPVITLVCPFGAVGTVSSQALMWQGATSVAIAEALQRAGYSTEILAVNCCATEIVGGITRHATVIRLSEPGQSLNLGALATVVAHAGMHRITNFGLRCLGKKAMQFGGYASTKRTEQEKWGYQYIHGRDSSFVIPTAFDEKKAKAACFNMVARIDHYAKEDATL